ncbi:hypothetical protein PTIM40_184 [Cyanophage P-TIM40]|uniref:Uncharacterized protein n=1 Tax=Cyanophage P-TIM40 TaxID=1589733 RepID=A0A0C5AMY0_9CAUD|nr:hypothetical protein AU107_gp184 [Cyanophage P-TIM40]AJK27605.1 hypothetical protein PTIM40_184 [Cyanophage P-TIM40]
MTLDIKVSAALMKYNFYEQRKILNALETGTVDKLTKHLREGAEKAIDVMDSWEPIVEGYGGFPIEKEAVAKKKMEFKRDKNVGRVVTSGGDQMLVTGRKADGRYVVMGKDGRKTAKDAVDIGVIAKEQVVGVDLDDLHESLKQARKNVGASTCWDGYKAKGTKKKGGKVVPNCVKEDEVNEGKKKGLWDNIHAKRKRGERPARPGEKDYPKTLNVESNQSFDAMIEALCLPEYEDLTFDEIHDICVETLLELDQPLLNEALDLIDSMELLTEAPSQHSANPNIAVQAPQKKKEAAPAKPSLKDRIKAGLKTAAKVVAKGAVKGAKYAGKAAGMAKNTAKDMTSAAKDGYKSTQKGQSSSGSSKSTSSTMSDTPPKDAGSSSTSGGSTTTSGSSGSGGDGSKTKENLKKFGSALKKGLKKVVGKGSRLVSKGAGKLAKRLGEQSRYDWRSNIKGDM